MQLLVPRSKTLIDPHPPRTRPPATLWFASRRETPSSSGRSASAGWKTACGDGCVLPGTRTKTKGAPHHCVGDLAKQARGTGTGMGSRGRGGRCAQCLAASRSLQKPPVPTSRARNRLHRPAQTGKEKSGTAIPQPSPLTGYGFIYRVEINCFVLRTNPVSFSPEENLPGPPFIRVSSFHALLRGLAPGATGRGFSSRLTTL